MAKINLLALGGLDEKQRRLYILEIDSKIYILDSGIYQPLNNDFGIRQIVPNIEYLKLNKDKIKAVFLSSSNRMNIGSLIQIINLKKDVEVYGSKVTIDALPILFGKNVNNWNTKIINNQVNVAGIEVKPIKIASTIPGTLGYQFHTNDGNILYMTDYIIDSIKEFNINQIVELNKLSNNNLLLITDSSNSTEKIAISSKFRIKDLVSKYLKQSKRFVITIYEDEIINAVELIELAKENKRKIFFKSKTLLSLLKMMMKNKAIEEFPIRSFEEFNENESNKSIVVLSGTRTKLYRSVELIIESHNKKDFAFDKNDIVYFAALPQPGNEHIFADVTNKIAIIDPDVVKPSSEEKKLFGTTEFDIRNLINLVRPRFVMPVSSYYKQLKEVHDIAIIAGMNKKNIIIGENGEIFTINKGVYEGVSQKIKEKEIEPMVVESIGDPSINNDLIEERKTLGKDGVVTISFIYQTETALLASDIDIQMKGLVISKGNDDVLNKLKEMVYEAADTYHETNQKITKSIPQLRKAMSRVFRENFKKVPTLIFNILEE